jgi:hypothetical protein
LAIVLPMPCCVDAPVTTQNRPFIDAMVPPGSAGCGDDPLQRIEVGM